MAESLRSRTFGELFGQTFQVFFKCLGRLLAVQMVLWLPIMTFVGIGVALCLSMGLAEPAHSRGMATGIMGALVAVATICGLLLMPLQSALTMIVISDHILGQRTPVATAFAIAFKNLLGIITISLVTYVLPWVVPAILVATGVAADQGVLIGVGVVLMLVAFVVGMMLFTSFFVAGPALVLEQVGPATAFSRSRMLTANHRWSILGLYFIISFLAGMVVNFLVLPLHIFTTVIVESQIGAIASNLFGNLLQQTLGGAFGGVLTVLVYFDLRVKKDGFDIENLAELVEVIAAREGSAPAGHAANETAPSP